MDTAQIIESLNIKYTEIGKRHIPIGHVGWGSWPAYIDVLTKLNIPVHSILEIGFNGGHSAAMFCEVFPHARMLSIDIASNPVCAISKNLIDRWYPGQHTLFLEDSKTALPKLRQQIFHAFIQPFDILFVDGWHSDGMPKLDMFNCQFLAHADSIVIIDDVYGGWDYQIEPTETLQTFIALGAYNEIGKWVMENGVLGFSYGTFGKRIESLDLIMP